MAASYRKTPVLESFFNFEYCEIFKSTYFEKDQPTAPSENVFMKLRKVGFIRSFECYIKKRVFSTSMSEASQKVCFYFMIGFP